MGFIANATGSIDAEGWTPAVEDLFAGHGTPAQVLKSVQTAYEQELNAP
jgi:raffinose/stachyose/melibiose transport system substrate-binding protein